MEYMLGCAAPSSRRLGTGRIDSREWNSSMKEEAPILMLRLVRSYVNKVQITPLKFGICLDYSLNLHLV
jgi:hypothetical protein